MMERCYNSDHPRFKDYGAIGAKVCKRWHDKETFLLDCVTLEGFSRKSF